MVNLANRPHMKLSTKIVTVTVSLVCMEFQQNFAFLCIFCSLLEASERKRTIAPVGFVLKAAAFPSWVLCSGGVRPFQFGIARNLESYDLQTAFTDQSAHSAGNVLNMLSCSNDSSLCTDHFNQDDLEKDRNALHDQRQQKSFHVCQPELFSTNDDRFLMQL